MSLSKSCSLPLLSGAAIVVAAVALLWPYKGEVPTAPLAQDIGRHSEVAGKGAQDDHRLQQELGALTEEIDALWEAQEAQAELVEEAVAGAEVAPSGPDLSPDEQTEAFRQTLSATLNKEAVDRDWAPEAQASLEGGLQKLGGALASVDRVECRATLCVVEFEYDAAAVDPAALAESLGQLAPWPNNAISSIQTTEDHQGWLYLSREGHALPGA